MPPPEIFALHTLLNAPRVSRHVHARTHRNASNSAGDVTFALCDSNTTSGLIARSVWTAASVLVSPDCSGRKKSRFWGDIRNAQTQCADTGA